MYILWRQTLPNRCMAGILAVGADEDRYICAACYQLAEVSLPVARSCRHIRNITQYNHPSHSTGLTKRFQRRTQARSLTVQTRAMAGLVTKRNERVIAVNAVAWERSLESSRIRSRPVPNIASVMKMSCQDMA